jgi:hypothetical protein
MPNAMAEPLEEVLAVRLCLMRVDGLVHGGGWGVESKCYAAPERLAQVLLQLDKIVKIGLRNPQPHTLNPKPSTLPALARL